jgi:glyoxylase-like metal-dependent hydrolase (beta-lactamase superfamily II)
MEVLPGVHQIRDDLPNPGVWVALGLFVDDEATLLDTGLPTTPRDKLIPYFKEINLAPTRVTTIVNTHFHGDHTGGNAEMKALCQSRLMAHRDEVAYIENPRAGMEHYVQAYPKYNSYIGLTPEEIEAKLPRPAKVDRVLEEGDELKLSGRNFGVIHTPGHTAGSISLLDKNHGTLYCGDALQAEGMIDSLAYYHDVDQYLGSLAKVEALELAAIAPAHGYRPYSEALLKGTEVKRFLNICREVTTRYDQQIIEVLRKAGRPLTLGEVTVGVRGFYGMAGWNFTSIAPVNAHLTKLEQSGAVRHSHGPGELVWEAM